MSDIRIFSGKYTVPEFESTLRALGMRKGAGQDACDKIRHAYDRLFPEVRQRIVPKAACTVLKSSAGGQMVIAITLGEAISKYQNKLIEENCQYEALVADAMAVSALFSFERFLKQPVISICHEMNIGIAEKVVPKNDRYPEFVRFVCKNVDSERTIGVSVTDDGMMLPPKSMCEIYNITDDISQMNFGHSCRGCTFTNCQMRDTEDHESEKMLSGITKNAEPSEGHRGTVVICPPEVNVLDYLRKKNIPINAPCGGMGICGQCRVRVIRGEAPVSSEDRHFFDENELAEGWRLACRLVPEERAAVEIPKKELTERIRAVSIENVNVESRRSRGEPYSIAVDIGTTTLAAALVDPDTGRILRTETGVNHQKKFGADVVSRTQSALAGHAEELRDIIRSDLRGLLHVLVGEETEGLKEIAVSANTVMQHLLMGWDVRGLTEYPFKPFSLGGTYRAEEVFGSGTGFTECSVTLIPGISAYVGGDITAGIYAGDLDQSKEPVLLVDLGTNGEIAYGSADGIRVGSTAAGPALEGGNLSCGMSSVPGAICSVSAWDRKPDNAAEKIKAGRPDSAGSRQSADSQEKESQRTLFKIKTIDGRPPAGLCGTGVIELVAALRETNIIDRTGRLSAPYQDTGVPVAQNLQRDWIYFTQADIREVQLAKGAIRAGIECITGRGDVKKLVLAGGFGYYLNSRKAAEIGLIPERFVTVCDNAGNTALKGAARFLADKDRDSHIRHIINISNEDILANDSYFNELFIKYMNF